MSLQHKRFNVSVQQRQLLQSQCYGFATLCRRSLPIGNEMNNKIIARPWYIHEQA